jgi:hypothetical protein
MKETGINNFTIDDFIDMFPEEVESSRSYRINKDIFILNKIIKTSELQLNTYDVNDIKKHVQSINNYINWLNNCKNELINTYCEILDSYYIEFIITNDFIFNNKWYEKLIIKYCILSLEEDGSIDADITCIDPSRENKIFGIYIYNKVIEVKYKDDYDLIINKNKSNGNICKIHNKTMNKKHVNNLYGIPIECYEREIEKLFPNSDDYIVKCNEDDEYDDKYLIEMEYVCEYCNNARDEWINKYKSVMYIRLNKNIKDNFIIYINDNYKYIIEKEKERDNYWIIDFALPNGKYKVAAKNKKTNKICAIIDIELNNERIHLNIEKENEEYIFKIDYKSEFELFSPMY